MASCLAKLHRPRPARLTDTELTATDPLSGSAAAPARANQYARRPPCAMATTASKGNAMVRHLERLAGFTAGSSLAAWPPPGARALGVSAVPSAGTNRKPWGRGQSIGSGDDALNSLPTTRSFRQIAMVKTSPNSNWRADVTGSSELSIAGAPSPPESRESTCYRRQGKYTSVSGRRYLSRTGFKPVFIRGFVTTDATSNTRPCRRRSCNSPASSESDPPASS